jgi:iron-sulfur cluster repair protein YtfE (RIC family)
MNEQSIKVHFEADHDRLDGLFKKFQELKRVDFQKAIECFKQFKVGLQRHIVWEEEILFPLFERKMGSPLGPTQVMRMEHRQIREYLESIHKKVHEHPPKADASGGPESDQEEQMLLTVLSAHNQKEENILYPAIDRSISDEERTYVFSAMKNIPEERYQFCCKDT